MAAISGSSSVYSCNIVDDRGTQRVCLSVKTPYEVHRLMIDNVDEARHGLAQEKRGAEIREIVQKAFIALLVCGFLVLVGSAAAHAIDSTIGIPGLSDTAAGVGGGLCGLGVVGVAFAHIATSAKVKALAETEHALKGAEEPFYQEVKGKLTTTVAARAAAASAAAP